MTSLEQFIQEFTDFYDGHPWYGSSFRDIIEDITPAEALTVPGNGHSIARLLCHINKWRRSLSIRLEGNLAFRASNDDPDNWPLLNTLDETTWENAKQEFDELQTTILTQLKKRDESFLDTPFSPGKPDLLFRYLVAGVIQHDIYHLGQISLLKQLLRSAETTA